MAAVIVHGGAYAIPDSIAEDSLAGCREASECSYEALMNGKSAVEAVELAVRSLEDNPVFNAGHGAVLNEAGKIEMDAIIVDGSTLNFGAVAGVKDIANPISLARMVMDCTDHVMLIGEGANTFAAQMGIPTVDPNDLISPVAKMRWEEWSKYDSVVKDSFNSKADDKSAKYVDTPDHETVGAVAMDLQGNIAAATSTGGITLKKLGRVGDSPLIGSGACCDNGIGGVSTTGHGESIAKVVLAYRALQQLQLATSRHKTSPAPGYSLESAFKDSLGFMMERVNGCAGMIGIDRNGMIAKWHTTPRMSWASVDSRGKRECGLSVNG